jgi:alpha-tubulin suppressor-like RCC1 family protein
MKKNMFILTFILSFILTTLAQANPIENEAVQIAAGYYHSLAIKEDGSVWAWGYNGHGELGDGTTKHKRSPVQVSGLSQVTKIAAGLYHSLALKEDGSVWAWGYNGHGELGDGTTTNKSSPVQVSGLSQVTRIAAGYYHSLALKEDGSVWAWGYNGHGELGDRTTTNKSSPVQVSGLSQVTMIAVGYHHSMALKNDGTVWAWGYNNYGNLGNGTTTNTTSPVQVSGLSHVIKIVAGGHHSHALKDDGTVWAWGDNNYGNLGDGTTTNRSSPVQVSGLSHVTRIAAGSSHSLALKEDGSVWAWGYNVHGQLGDGTTTNKSSPVQVSGLSHVTMIAAGSSHSLALKEDGSGWAWGRNNYGQLGDGTTTNKSSPVQVSGLSHVTMIAAGSYHSLALKEDGSVWAWGWNNYGQLGDGTTTNKSSPVQVSGLSQVTRIAAGYYHSLALKDDGSVWAWGYNGNGELGDGTTRQKTSPVKVTGLSHVIMIAAKHHHCLALKEDGSVWAWGYNGYGQLGDGTTTNKSSPVQVSGLSQVTMIAVGYQHSMALKNDGTVWAWGYNNYGNLGNGTTTNKSSPVQVSGFSHVIKIIAGGHYSHALKDDGTVWAWGYNNYGNLCDGTTTNRTSPVKVSGLSHVTMIAAGYHHSLAIKDDSSVWAWGINNYGQLCDGTTTNRSSPVQVSGLSHVTMNAAGSNHSLALKDDGSVWAWGQNHPEYGQLGYGYPTYLPEPVYSEIQFNQKTYTTSPNTTITIPVINTAQKNMTVSFRTINGSAISGIDYIHTSGNLTFQANEKQKEIPITILNNPENNTEKTFVLNIGASDDIFLNDGSQAIITISSRYAVNTPYSQTFTQHMPVSGWTKYSENNGRIQQTAGRLRMDSSLDNTDSLNEAILHIDLSSAENVHLTFFQKSIVRDICTSLPPVFFNHYNGDGVSISNDGYTWYRLMDSMDLMTDAVGQNYAVNLSDIESAIQANHDENFHLNQYTQIKFQQSGNRTYPSGGREWDNISVVCTPKSTIQFQQTTHMISNEGYTYIPVLRTNNIDSSATVDYATQNGTAIAGLDKDYAEFSGQLVFAPGETLQYIKVLVFADIFRNQDINFQVMLSNPSEGYYLYEPHTCMITISCHQHISQSYEQSFDHGLPASGWQYYSSDSHGRIQVENNVLRMNATSASLPILNEAELRMDLSWADQVNLSFVKQSYETSDPIPDRYTGHVNGDGVSISTDGITWYAIVSAADLDSPYTQLSVHLNQKISEINLLYGDDVKFCDDFKIRFQQYNNQEGMMGRDWDNINVNVSGHILELDTDVIAMPGDPFTIPLTLNNPNQQPIEDIYAVLAFDKTVLTPLSATLEGGFLNADDYQVDISTDIPNELLISIYCRSAYSYSSGTAAFLTFRAGSTRFDSSAMAFDVAEINETPVNARDGYFMIKNDRPEITRHIPQSITMYEDTTFSGITITVADTETSTQFLNVTAITSNPTLFPVDSTHFQFMGTDANRTLNITPALHRSGTAAITLVVTDEKGLGQTTSFDVLVIAIPDPPVFSGDFSISTNEDTPVTLTILHSLLDADGSEHLSDLFISNVPEGALFSSGQKIQKHIWQFQKSELSQLTFTPPLNDDSDLSLYLSATATENSNSQSASATQTLQISVLAVADPADYTIPQNIYGDSDVYFPMNMMALRTDVDGSETLRLIVSNMPSGAKLSAGTDNGDNSWTVDEKDIPGLQLIPPRQDDSEFSLAITILMTESNENSIWRKDFTMDVVVTGYRISGKVMYYANDIPVRNVLMTLSGELTYTAVTDNNGQYVIPAVSPGYYILNPSKKDDLLGVSQTDASDIARFIIHSQDLTCTTMIAADVSLNRSISPKDVSDTSIYAVPGLLKSCINEFCKPWTFSSIRPVRCDDQVVQSTPYRQYVLDTDQPEQNFIAFRLGDVTGNWQPDDIPTQAKTLETRYKARIFSTESAQESYPFTVAIAIDEPLAIRGIDIGITYDPDVVEAVSAKRTGSLLEHSDYELIYGTGIRGEISLGVHTNNEILTTSGEIISIQFNFIGNESARSPLAFKQFSINEQSPGGGFLVDNHLSSHVEVALDNGVPVLFDTETQGPSPIGIIPDQTIMEDSAIHSIPLTTLAGCNSDLIISTSDTSLIALENISYTCLSDTFYISLTPTADQSGAVMITITVIDEKNLASSTSFEISVWSLNDPPVAIDAEFFTIENQDINGGLNCFDKDSVIQSYTIVSYPSKGNVTINDGQFTYSPDVNQYGEDSFTFVVYDDFNARSNTANVNIFITPINSHPIAYSKDVTVYENKYIYIKLIAADPDNDNLTYHLLNLPSHGEVSQITDTVLYRPDINYYGPDAFTYKVNDGLCNSEIASIMITVYPGDRPSQAISQQVDTTENMPVDITLTGFSPYQKPLTFRITEPPTHGILSQSTPYLTYTPDTDFNGSDAFMFIVNDGVSDSSPATITITVDRSDSYVLNILGVGHGTVKINSATVMLPWESRFQTDQKVCFEAVPDSDWRFINWTGDFQSTENSVCVTVDKNKTITANMAIKTFALTIQGNEIITINNEQYNLPFSQMYEINTPIILESTSERFNCWEEGDSQTFQNPFEFMIQSNMSINANFYPVPDWQTEIHVERWVDNTNAIQHNSVFMGVASQAYTRKTSDIPNNYSCDIVLNDQSFDALNKDIQKDCFDEYQWLIAVDPHGSEGNPYVQTTATISWDASTFSPEGNYVLKNETGEIVVSDMRTITEYQVSGTSYKTFTIIWQRREIFEFHLNKGWNLISLPVNPDMKELKQLFPDYESAYEYKKGAYISVTTMIPGKGYWLKVPSQKVYSISGQPLSSYTINLPQGLHLVGWPFEKTALDMSTNNVCCYIDGKCEQIFSLQPGLGYWIRIIPQQED